MRTRWMMPMMFAISITCAPAWGGPEGTSDEPTTAPTVTRSQDSRSGDPGEWSSTRTERSLSEDPMDLMTRAARRIGIPVHGPQEMTLDDHTYTQDGAYPSVTNHLVVGRP